MIKFFLIRINHKALNLYSLLLAVPARQDTTYL